MQKAIQLASDELGKVRSDEAVKRMSGGVRDSVNSSSLQKISLQKEFKKNIPTEHQRTKTLGLGTGLVISKPASPTTEIPVLPDNLKSYLEYAFEDDQRQEMEEKMIQLIKDNPCKSDRAYKLLFQKKYLPVD
jgi:hypothetical protein